MLDYHDRTIRFRIVFTGILLPVIVITPMICAFYLYDKNNNISSHLDKAKALCLTAENRTTQNQCEVSTQKVSNSFFDLSFANRQSLIRKQLNDNEPSHFYQLDKSRDVLRYTQFVRARKSCMTCHGDPERSKKLWAGKNNHDELPADFTGLKDGDICGAYQVTIPLYKNSEHASAPLTAACILLAGFSIYTIAFFAVISYIINSHTTEPAEKHHTETEIYDFGRSAKNKRDNIIS